MADFTARWTTPGSTVTFTDEVGSPTRLNPRSGKPHRRYELVVSLSGALVAKATVSGSEGPLDATLGGRLFSWHWVQWPGYPTKPAGLPTISTPAGQSSVASADVSGWPTASGLWILCCRRADGGAVMLPLTTREVAL